MRIKRACNKQSVSYTSTGEDRIIDDYQKSESPNGVYYVYG